MFPLLLDKHFFPKSITFGRLFSNFSTLVNCIREHTVYLVHMLSASYKFKSTVEPLIVELQGRNQEIRVSEF